MEPEDRQSRWGAARRPDGAGAAVGDSHGRLRDRRCSSPGGAGAAWRRRRRRHHPPIPPQEELGAEGGGGGAAERRKREALGDFSEAFTRWQALVRRLGVAGGVLPPDSLLFPYPTLWLVLQRIFLFMRHSRVRTWGSDFISTCSCIWQSRGRSSAAGEYKKLPFFWETPSHASVFAACWFRQWIHTGVCLGGCSDDLSHIFLREGSPRILRCIA